jgi:hypothetical protein
LLGKKLHIDMSLKKHRAIDYGRLKNKIFTQGMKKNEEKANVI